MKQLAEIMARLRSESGCPWDREQTLDSLKQFLVEECYELIDAIDSGDPARHMDELGDLLLQVVFQAQIRGEQGKFTLDDVVRCLAAKLIRRHPHVFGQEKADTPQAVLRRWEAIKADEKSGAKERFTIEGVPRHLPALLKAQRVQGRASRVGFDWANPDDVAAKVDEELLEVRQAMAAGQAERLREELGDLLFSVANLARFMEVNAEEALDGAVVRFVRRFRGVEERAMAAGRKLADCSLAEMDRYWEAVKEQEDSHGQAAQ